MMFYTQEQYDEAHTPLATPADAMREYAAVVGAEHPDKAWISTDFDSWVPNPYYVGPKVPHPEDYEYDD